MKIFLISYNDWSWDCYSDHIIVAKDEHKVRELARSIAADEGESVWDNATVTVEGNYKGDKKEPFILLSSFHAG